ncbi:hypothetical protein FRC10_006197 [Ceratobasidium sp. 414]|nr:hypothetical protein FRC10_006197 [Ceratobasidium sp. 414]
MGRPPRAANRLNTLGLSNLVFGAMRYDSALALLLPTVIRAAIPLSKQHPLIARVDRPYSWSLSPLTFDDLDTASISIRDAPDWLGYDNATSTFRGRPTAEDIGITTVYVRNKLGTSDCFLLCVTDLPSPIVNIPLASQLVPGNPSISSGFTFPAPGVGVRVPPKWSFSIGFDGYTFTTPDERNIFYDAALDNGLPLPRWVVFNNRTLTFDGVAPPENRAASLSIILHGSDRWGFGAIYQQFDLVVGPRTHLLGIDGTGGLETVNVTGGAPFTHSIQTFGGLVIDGVQVVSANVSRVEVNVSSVPWVTFDNTTRVLSGFPPTSAIGQPPYVLPVSITSDYNETVSTNLSIVAFPSYFTASRILPLVVTPGAFLTFSVQDYFSHARSAPATIAPQFVPRAASSWLSYNNANHTLNGFVPRSTTYNEVNITFYATDLETHAVSAVSMLLSIASNETSGPETWSHSHGANHSVQAKTAIIVTFSIIGGAVLLCCLLALCRRYCGVREFEEDHESSSQWKGQDLASSSAHRVVFSEKIMRAMGSSRTSAESSDDSCKSQTPLVIPPGQGDLHPSLGAKTMKKVHFFQSLLTPSKRKLGDEGPGSHCGNIRRSQISRPTPINDTDTLTRMLIARTESGSRSDESGAPSHLEKRGAGSIGVAGNTPRITPKAGPNTRGSEALALESSAQVTPDRSSQTPSVSDGSSLTSIPRRRSDFLPPRHQRTTLPDQVCGDGIGSLATSGSSGTVNLSHDEGAVISTAARQTIPTTISTTSVPRSVVRSSTDSAASRALNKHQSLPGSPGSVSVTGIRRPRLVQLNSEHRVPTLPNGGATTVRNASQKAVVTGSSNGHAKEESTEETDPDQRLSLGIHYISGLGGDDSDSDSAVFYLTPSVGKAPSPTTGNYSPHGTAGTRSTSGNAVGEGKAQLSSRQQLKKIPIGAPFTISVQFETIPARGAELMVRRQDGKPAPKWINLDQRDVELWGVPLKEHRGMHLLEIVEKSGSGQRIVARMCLEVVEWE